jgi:hypothetical protein
MTSVENYSLLLMTGKFWKIIQCAHWWEGILEINVIVLIAPQRGLKQPSYLTRFLNYNRRSAPTSSKQINSALILSSFNCCQEIR